MKIGIITFHKALSYGAGFQAYALQEYLIQKGHEVEIIDYVPKRFSFGCLVFKQSKSKSLKSRIIRFIPYTICKGTQFWLANRFANKHINLSSSKYRYSYDFGNESFHYDVIITGSDQVWNINYDAFDAIKPYLLDIKDEHIKRISYASSIGMDSFDGIDNATQKEFSDLLLKYYKISVREDRAVCLLEIGIKSQQVLDPTFLLRKDDWQHFAQAPNHKQKYVFVYGLYRNKELYDFANKIAEKNGFSVINMADSYDFNLKAKNKIVVTHEKLLGYIANAQCVVTDSFHGAALSVNMEKPLFVFSAPRYNTRLESLIHLFDLQERYVSKKDFNFSDYNMDYIQITEKLEKERKKSIEFLNEALNEKQKNSMQH